MSEWVTEDRPGQGEQGRVIEITRSVSDLSRGQKIGIQQPFLKICSLVPWTNLSGASDFNHSSLFTLTWSALCNPLAHPPALHPPEQKRPPRFRAGAVFLLLKGPS